MATCYINRAAAALKEEEWARCEADCTAALAIAAASDGVRRKALARRATAAAERGDTAQARRDLALLPAADPMAQRLRAISVPSSDVGPE